ncbi:hypothetical protein [Streptomyces atriruber]|uniref:hypothetical protein n=1 Tax=Streptomyces atriruber TaxID=545121 RepID=UPI0006E27B9D|nr:hypothetical protein [Streptomyces atriruber]
MAIGSTLEEAVGDAEKMLLSPTRLDGRGRLRLEVLVGGLLREFRPLDPELVGDAATEDRVLRLIHLAKLLGALGMNVLSKSVAGMALRCMEIVEADREVYAASVWNELGALLAEHGELEAARAVLRRALSGAALDRHVPERGRILANLGAVSLRRGDLEGAEFWAGKALKEMESGQGDDPDARLTADWVRLEVARAGWDAGRMGDALRGFDRSAERSIALKGGDHPVSIAARRALATARFEAAADSHDVELGEQQLRELEVVKLNASAFLGVTHRETVVAQAALAVAEFEAASGQSASLMRRQRAAALLEAAELMAVETLGRENAQTLAIREALAHLRAAMAQTDDYPFVIEHMYMPGENAERNGAKLGAIETEQSMLWLIAHGGSSYFLSETDRFRSAIIGALERRVTFRVIISSPWNNLASSTPIPREPPEDARLLDLVDAVKESSYYRESFLPVINAYLGLKERYPDFIELKLARIDLSGSILLTSDLGFFEPYITTDPEGRTRRGPRVFEVKFLKDSAYYADSAAQFQRLWKLSSTWKQFQAGEDPAQDALRVAWRHWPTVT